MWKASQWMMRMDEDPTPLEVLQCLKDLHLVSQPLPQQRKRQDVVVGDCLEVGMESNMLCEPGDRVEDITRRLSGKALGLLSITSLLWG